MRDGWNITGDTFVRANGHFSFGARADDMIVSSGYNIAGPEVEAALLSHPAVAECGVVGAPDEARGMIVKAYVVTAPDVTADAALVTALQDHVKNAIAALQISARDRVHCDAAQDRDRQVAARRASPDGAGGCDIRHGCRIEEKQQ